jgi:hypothetical protein
MAPPLMVSEWHSAGAFSALRSIGQRNHEIVGRRGLVSRRPLPDKTSWPRRDAGDFALGVRHPECEHPLNRDRIEHQLACVERSELRRADNSVLREAGASTIDAVVADRIAARVLVGHTIVPPSSERDLINHIEARARL